MPSWIPYWTFYTVQSAPEKLTVVAPPDLVWFVLMTAVFLAVFLRDLFRDWRAGTTTPLGLLFIAILYIVLFSLIGSHGSIALDRKTQTATVHEVHIFFIPTTKTTPLSQVHGADIHYAPGSSHLVLETDSPEDYSISGWTSMSGQAKAANTVNDFLRNNGSSQSR